jgi:SAM-dependent methyltransferase
VSAPAVTGYIRYLAAKQALDDRSLNRQVWESLVQTLRNRPDANPLKILEVGCGIGAMVQRLLAWGLPVRAEYTGIDIEAAFIREAGERLKRHPAAHPPDPARAAPGFLVLESPGARVRVNLEAIDLLAFVDREQGKSTWDLIVAHAVLDLMDLATVLPRLWSLAAPGGLFYFTLNFDGATILTPPVDPDLDALIEALYHRSMDRRRRGGQPAGSSITGRRLLGELAAAGARVAAAGSSDWVVFPGPDGYPGDEAYFLHFIIDTIGRALHGHPELPLNRFQAWLARRHGQIDARELIYVAHQLDVMGYWETSRKTFG